MFVHILYNEILGNLFSPKFYGTSFFCFFLILMSLYTGLGNYKDNVVEYRTTKELSRKILSEQTSYEKVSTIGMQVSKPPGVPSIIVSGLGNNLGRHTLVNIHANLTLTGGKIEGNPIFGIFGDLDMAFLVKTVFSLLAILFTYNSISGEKEEGTLRLILSHPVPRDTLILGKMVGGFLCFMIPLSVPVCLGFALLTMSPNFHPNNQEIIQLLLVYCVFVLYLSVFFNLGMFVSASTSRSNISFLVLLLIWVAWTLVIPKGSVILAGQFTQVPSIHKHRIQSNQVKRDVRQNLIPDLKRINIENPPSPPRIKPGTPKGKREEIIAHYRRTSSEWRAKQLASLKEFEARVDAEWKVESERMEKDYHNKQERLAKLAMGLSRISPSSAMTLASMNIAGTGIESQEHFLNLARAYKENFIFYLKSKEEALQGVKSRSIWEDRSRPFTKSATVDISDMPIFRYQKESLSDVMGRVIIDLMLLAVISIAFFVGAYVSFLKYDPR